MSFIDVLSSQLPNVKLSTDPDSREYLSDRATANTGARAEAGPVVAFPRTIIEVQALVRLANEHGISIVPRGRGTGLSGGSSANSEQLVISTERFDRILEINVDDQVAVVEPGVINQELNDRAAEYGLFYAADPASYDIASIGGNIATNAGGLHSAKYGVTREQVLALRVVLADGSLVTLGHRSIKGVTGLDIVSLFTGSEGVLGIVVEATIRLRRVPVATRTVTAFFDTTIEAAEALLHVGRSSVQPAVLELLDGVTLQNIDEGAGTDLHEQGEGLLLIELDGFGLDEQFLHLEAALAAAGGRVKAVLDPAAADELWRLRRGGRGRQAPVWGLGHDIALPKSQIPAFYRGFADIEARFQVAISGVAHAGDGNIHAGISRPRPASAAPDAPIPEDLFAASYALVRLGISLGGTLTGEHGVGTLKRRYLDLELSGTNRALQHAVKAAFDPSSLLNPGKAI